MVLLSAVYEEYRLIAFDTEKKFSYEEYYEKCFAKSNENVLSAVIPLDKDTEKLVETAYLAVFLYMSVFFFHCHHDIRTLPYPSQDLKGY